MLIVQRTFIVHRTNQKVKKIKQTKRSGFLFSGLLLDAELLNLLLKHAQLLLKHKELFTGGCEGLTGVLGRA